MRPKLKLAWVKPDTLPEKWCFFTFLRQKDFPDSIADIFSGFASISNLISKMKSVDLAVTFSNRDLMPISCILSSGDVFHNLSDN